MMMMLMMPTNVMTNDDDDDDVRCGHYAKDMLGMVMMMMVKITSVIFRCLLQVLAIHTRINHETRKMLVF